jgi:hypothetical protein
MQTDKLASRSWCNVRYTNCVDDLNVFRMSELWILFCYFTEVAEMLYEPRILGFYHNMAFSANSPRNEYAFITQWPVAYTLDYIHQ